MKRIPVFVLVFFPVVLMAAPKDIIRALQTGTAEQIQAALAGKDVNVPLEGGAGLTPLCMAAKWNRNAEAIDALLSLGAEVNGRDKSGNSAIIYAAAYNTNPAVSGRLIKAGADLNARWESRPDGDTPVTLAHKNKNTKVLDVFLQAGAKVDPNAVEGNVGIGMTPLMNAIFETPNDVKNVKRFIPTGVRAARIEDRDPRWQKTALHYAAARASREVVSLLLAAGANVNALDGAKGTPLIDAAAGNPDPQVITVLLQAGADAGLRGGLLKLTAAEAAESNPSVRGTPQHQELKRIAEMAEPKSILESAERGTVDEVRAALARGEKVNARITVSEAAAAQERGRQGGVLHFDYHAAVFQMTPLQLAAENNPDPDVVTVLIQSGAKVDERNQATNSTPLMYAASQNRNPRVAAALLSAGASVNAVDGLGKKPLMHAVEVEGNLEILHLLIQAGAKVEMQDLMGQTALMTAASINMTVDNIRALLQAGADPHVKDVMGKTALDAVKKNFEGSAEYEKVLELLK